MTNMPGNTAFDGEHGTASVGDRETDVDRGDRRQPERLDGRRIKPPERERRGRLRDSDDQSRRYGCSQPGGSGCARASTLTLEQR
jgi:hypothetical protein